MSFTLLPERGRIHRGEGTALRPIWLRRLPAVLAVLLCALSGLGLPYAVRPGQDALTAACAALLFAAGVLLMLLFLAGIPSEGPDPGLFCGGLAFFAWMAGLLCSTASNGQEEAWLGRMLACTALLVLLATRSGRYGRALWVLAGLHAGLVAVFALWPLLFPGSGGLAGLMVGGLPGALGLGGLLAGALLGTVFWRRENLFYRLFPPLLALGLAAICLALVLLPEWRETLRLAAGQLAGGLYGAAVCLSLVAAAVCLLGELAERERARRAQARFLSDQVQQLKKSYEELRAHDEEVMMLRHDMASHLRILREKVGQGSARAVAYLDELIGQNEAIRPVIQSGNEMLDILLGGALADAARAGVDLQVCRAQPPARLPLSDAELSSVIMNIMNNAVQAAARTRAALVRLDLHCGSGFFILVCENTAPVRQEQQEQRGPVPAHGLGLKIIRRITRRHNGVFKIEQEQGRFRVTLAVPVEEGRKEDG